MTEYRKNYILQLYSTPHKARRNLAKMFSIRKTRMIGLPYTEKSMSYFLQYRNVRDGRTDGQTDRRTELAYQYCASALLC